MSVKSLDQIFQDFDPKSGQDPGMTTRPVTIWLPAEYKARYDQLQKMSNRRFCKKVGELIQAAIDMAESKAS